MKPKRSDRASGRSRRPSQESNRRQSKGEELPPTPDGQPGTSTGQGPVNSVKDSLAFMREVEEYFKDVDPGKYTAFANLLVAQKRGRVGRPCMISQVKELFRGHTEVLKLFNEILHPDLKILFKEDVPEIQDLAKLYVAKVKARSSPSVYTTFMYILYLYNERALTSDEVDQEVEVLFAKSCDLLEEYDCFQPDRAAPVVQSPLHPRHSALEVSELQREQQCERLKRMCEKVAKRKRKEKGKGVVTERKQQPPPPQRVSARLVNTANALGNRRSSRSSVEAHPRRPTRSAIASATPAAETQGRRHTRSRGLENAEYNERSICTPSYRLLKPPKNGDGKGKGEVSVHRSELAKSVLNEECELVQATKSEWRTCNPHEEVLFKCEADQYECDVISRRMEATAKSFMNYLFKLREPNIRQMPPMEEFLSAVHKRCIKQLYDDDAQEFIAALEENPARALPVLLNRLVLKVEELRSKKAMMTQMWLQVYKNNFHLSLDHQSVDFKSKEKFKNINNFEASTSGSTNPI